MHFGEGVVLADQARRTRSRTYTPILPSQSASVARVVHLLTGIPYSFTGHAHDIWSDRLLLPEKIEEATFVVTCSDSARRCLVAASAGTHRRRSISSTTASMWTTSPTARTGRGGRKISF